MKVRFIMYPAEIGMEPVYQRLFAMDPNQRATPIKRLLGYLSCHPTLPVWFINLPSAPITTHRQQTVRLNLTSRDPDLIAVSAELEPMSEAERINHIKRMFARACDPKSRSQQVEAPLELQQIRESVTASDQETKVTTQSAEQSLTSPADQQKADMIRRSATLMLRR